jgi:hypothetical protein
MASMAATINKLRIDAYEKPEYTGLPVKTFEAYVNPSEITVSHEIEYHAAQAPGTTNSRMEFNRVKPGDLTISFFLDGTGASGRIISAQSGAPLTVQGKIAEFQSVTGYDGEIHRTNYLIVAWGDIKIRRCVLKSYTVAYKMFRPDGTPLRAVITATFTDNADDTTRTADENKRSPDLTRVHVVKAGDNLPALCYQMYDDPGYYLEVARANRIDDFRDIAPGTRIFFPPLEK